MAEYTELVRLMGVQNDEILVFDTYGVHKIKAYKFAQFDEDNQVSNGEIGRGYTIYLIVDSEGRQYGWKFAQQVFDNTEVEQ